MRSWSARTLILGLGLGLCAATQAQDKVELKVTTFVPPTHGFVVDVLDTSDAEKLTVTLKTLAAPPALGVAIFIVALLLLAFAIWKRSRRETKARGYVLALVGGFVLLTSYFGMRVPYALVIVLPLALALAVTANALPLPARTKGLSGVFDNA